MVKLLFRMQPREVWTKERTVLVENTPQQCVHNYGNAVYVPTYEDRVVERNAEVMEGKRHVKGSDCRPMTAM